jgi:peptide/nickel transport system permease protein
MQALSAHAPLRHMTQTESVSVNARGRLGLYLIRRSLTLLMTLAVGVYLAVMVANLGGYVDEITRANISEGLNAQSRGGWLKDATPEEKAQIFEETRLQMEEAAGLYDPFLLRCLRWTFAALTFQWAGPEIWDALPYTLLLFSVAVVVLLIASLAMSLALSTRYGSKLDRLMVSLSPLSAAPSWVHGIILIVIFAAILNWLPYGGVYDIEMPEDRLGYFLMVARHLVLPVGAIFLSAFFTLVYTWRTYFLIHSQEDYVDVARAKGLPDRIIEQRYILRPALPFVITNFALMVLAFWQTALVLEVYFDWPGIGRLYVSAVGMRSYQQNMVMSLMTLFAYLMAVSFFLLDLMYLLLDPRAGAEREQARISSRPWRGKRFTLRGMFEGLAGWRLPKLEVDVNGWREGLRRGMRSLGEGLRKLWSYPTAVVGIGIIAVLLAMSIYAMIFVPYDEVVAHWRQSVVEDMPQKAMPAWTNIFRVNKLPETIIMDSRDGTAVKQTRDFADGYKDVTLSYVFDYPYGGFPQDVVIEFNSDYEEKRPFVILNWISPNGRETELGAFSVTSETRFLAAQDKKLPRVLRSDEPVKQLFIDPTYSLVKARKGQYELRVTARLFEEDADIDGHLTIYGQVYGIGGTDFQRRDLWLGLLWGAPVALGVGLICALITSLASMLLAAAGVWIGGWVDASVQRLSEINLILPILPIGIMVYYLYSKSIWVILLVIIVFTVFGSPLKTYRAAFLQVKQMPYIEAAQAYGASNGRIIRHYLMPRILPVLVPQLVAMVPGFVFLEATLAMLGVTDQYLPTWGRIIYDAMINGALRGHYYWVLEPLALLMLTGIAFALVGLALDRILNPRLRAL